MPSIDITGRPIIITGASSGIGAATAKACARAGMPVALGARRVDKLADVVRDIQQAGGRAIAVATDVTKPGDCESLVRACEQEFGSVYAVYANAGYGEESPLHEMSDDRVREMFETNFFGSLNIIRPALARMLAKNSNAGSRGHVLWCSSCLARMSLPHYSIYCATKAAQAHCASAMRLELRAKGVHVSSVHPIGTKTEFSQQVTARAGGERKSIMTPDQFKQSAEFVGDCTVKCLRRPKGEVWPGVKSLGVRLSMGLATMFPIISDMALQRLMKQKLR